MATSGRERPTMGDLSAAQIARNKLGGHVRRNHPDRADDARRELAAAKLEAHIREAVAAWPPLTEAARAELALLLQAGEPNPRAGDGPAS